MTIGNVILMIAAGVGLSAIIAVEWRLRKSDAGAQFLDLVEQIGKREPHTGKVLRQLYRTLQPSNRAGHTYVRIAQAYLEALEAGASDG
jgi:hypothetical protein